MRLVFSIMILLMGFNSFAQNGMLRLYGRMEENGKVISDVAIEVIKDNSIIYEGETEKNGTYKLDLELGSVYNIAFQKEGYITKQVAVVAVHPEKVLSATYVFQLDLELFLIDSTDGANTVLPPVAKLYIKDVEKGFTYDKQYVKWVATHFEAIEED